MGFGLGEVGVKRILRLFVRTLALGATVGTALFASTSIAVSQEGGNNPLPTPDAVEERKVISFAVLVPADLAPALQEGVVVDLFWINSEDEEEQLILENLMVADGRDTIWPDADLPPYEGKPGMVVMSLSFSLSANEFLQILQARRAVEIHAKISD